MDNEQQQQDEERRRQEEEAVNAYADAMIKRDKERPKWLRDVATGARDDSYDISRGRS